VRTRPDFHRPAFARRRIDGFPQRVRRLVQKAVRLIVGRQQRLDPPADFRLVGAIAFQGRVALVGGKRDDVEEQALDFLRIGRHAWFSGKGFTLTCDVLTAACRKIWRNQSFFSVCVGM
jgi:hypothetical protein